MTDPADPADPADLDVPRVLPRGRHKLSRDAVRASQRQRLIEGMATATAQKGYAHVTITDIVSCARTARRTFYEHFEDKEECLLEVFSYVVEHVIQAMLERFDPALDQEGRVRGLISAILELLAANPVLAWTLLVDVNTAGPAGIVRRLEVHRRVAKLTVGLREQTRQRRPELAEFSELRALAIIGALHELVQHALHTRGAERLPEITDELVGVTIAMTEMALPHLAWPGPAAGRSSGV